MVENEFAEVTVADGWNLEVATCPTVDEVKDAEEARLIERMLGFNLSLKDWSAPEGMSEREIVDEFGKGLWWVVGEILEEGDLMWY